MSRLDIQHEGHVCHVYLNRPELRNAFDAETIAELTHTFSDLATDKALRAIVLGAHGKAFCAGADLNWMRAMADYTWAENHADGARLAQTLWTIASSPVPVIAKVQGDCYGGGVGLVACCDVVVAAEQVGFCLSEAKLGLSPATISPYVIKAIGERAARRYFVTGERFEKYWGARPAFDRVTIQPMPDPISRCRGAGSRDGHLRCAGLPQSEHYRRAADCLQLQFR